MIREIKKLNEKNSHVILFKSEKHKQFYQEYLPKCRFQDVYHKALVYCIGIEFQDVYHKALVYCIGIDQDTRDHVERIYDFKTGFINPKCLQEGWQTSVSKKIIRMAFNLYGNGMPSVFERKGKDRQIEECQCYGVSNLFCCSYARYFWEAIKLRYPEYCFD